MASNDDGGPLSSLMWYTSSSGTKLCFMEDLSIKLHAYWYHVTIIVKLVDTQATLLLPAII